METEEMIKKLEEHCDMRFSCKNCPLKREKIKPCNFSRASKEQIQKDYTLVFEIKDKAVSHPAHYNRDGAMECFDEMELTFGKEALKTFCRLNTWKYRYRAGLKGGEDDIKKSDEYMRKLKELESEESK